jgi:predicted ArsR family transcriptional regulator
MEQSDGIRGRVLAAVGQGNRTFRVARSVGLPTGLVRFHLWALERGGLVERVRHLSTSNGLFWRPLVTPAQDTSGGSHG